MTGAVVILAVVVGGPLVGYVLGRWHALWMPVVLCAACAGRILYEASTYDDTGDEFSGVVVFVVLVVVLPVWLLTTAAGVWLSRQRHHTSQRPRGA